MNGEAHNAVRVISEIPAEAKIVATRGDGIYLVDLGGGQGAVLNALFDRPRLSPVQRLGGILKFGYWTDIHEDTDSVLEALAREASAFALGFVDFGQRATSCIRDRRPPAQQL